MELFGIRLKNSVKRGWNCRDFIGAAVLFSLLIFIFYDKNFLESLGKRKTFSEVDRIVLAKLVPDLSFIGKRKKEEWFGEVSETLKAASGIFEREFGIRIICGGLEIWQDAAKIADLKKLRRDVKSGPCDIIIGFTKREISSDDKADVGKMMKNAIIIQKSEDSIKQYLILIHEVSHLFWAHHINKKGFLMSWDAKWYAEKVDNFNWRLIIFNKYKNFHKYDWLIFFKQPRFGGTVFLILLFKRICDKVLLDCASDGCPLPTLCFMCIF